MTSHTRSAPATAVRSPCPAPLCALLAALPLAALAQDAALQTITVKAPKTAVQPVAPLQPILKPCSQAAPASSDTAGLLRNLPGVSIPGSVLAASPACPACTGCPTTACASRWMGWISPPPAATT